MDSQTPIQQTDLSTQQPHKPFPLLSVSLGIIVFLLSASTSYFAYQNIRLSKELTAIQPPSSIPQISPISPSPEPTTDWKTYTNNEYLFTFNYPKNLSISNIYPKDPRYQQDQTILFGFELINLKGQTSYTFTVFNTNSLSLNNWIKQHLNKNLPPKEDITQQQQKQIKSLFVYELTYKFGTMFVFSDSNNRVYLLGTGIGSDANSANQILSTFKFTQQNTSCESNNDCPTGYYCNTESNFLDIENPGTELIRICRKTERACALEGENTDLIQNVMCCPELRETVLSFGTPPSCITSGGGVSGGVCTKCGNGTCGKGENACNCPEDCKK